MIRLEDVSKTFPGGVEAVRDVSLAIEEGETLALIGLSGCGKTTTLKMINRLVEATTGHIFVGGDNIRDRSPVELRRAIGYVIQDIGLFPHMTVAENVSIVMRLTGSPKSARRARTAELLDLVGLEPDDYMDRYPAELSGGQQQRVGVARALCVDPPVLLMDEPFGALDPITREQLQGEFRTLEEHIRKTIVLVTHDIFEAVLLGDRIGIMSEGTLVQVDTPEALVNRPASEFVERFLGKHQFQLQMSTAGAGDITVSGEDLSVRVLPGATPLDQALCHTDTHDIGSLVVRTEDERVVGVVGRAELESATGTVRTLAEVVDDSAPILGCDSNVLEAVRALRKSDGRFVPVVDDRERLVGIITRSSVARALGEMLGLEGSEALEV